MGGAFDGAFFFAASIGGGDGAVTTCLPETFPFDFDVALSSNLPKSISYLGC
jgi:hypothetical protein